MFDYETNKDRVDRWEETGENNLTPWERELIFREQDRKTARILLPIIITLTVIILVFIVLLIVFLLFNILS